MVIFFFYIILLQLNIILIIYKMPTETQKKNHTLDNKQRDLCTYFIKPCLPTFEKELSPASSDFERISVKLVSALSKLSKTKRTKTNIQKLLLSPNFEEFVRMLKSLKKIETDDLKKFMKVQLPSAQDYVRMQICEKYQEISHELWRKYSKAKTGSDVDKMKYFIDWVILEKKLDWQTSDQHKKRFSLRKTIQAEEQRSNSASQIYYNSELSQQKEPNIATNLELNNVMHFEESGEQNGAQSLLMNYEGIIQQSYQICSTIISSGQFQGPGIRNQAQQQLGLSPYNPSWDPFNQSDVFSFFDLEGISNEAEL